MSAVCHSYWQGGQRQLGWSTHGDEQSLGPWLSGPRTSRAGSPATHPDSGQSPRTAPGRVREIPNGRFVDEKQDERQLAVRPLWRNPAVRSGSGPANPAGLRGEAPARGELRGSSCPCDRRRHGITALVRGRTLARTCTCSDARLNCWRSLSARNCRAVVFSGADVLRHKALSLSAIRHCPGFQGEDSSRRAQRQSDPVQRRLEPGATGRRLSDAKSSGSAQPPIHARGRLA